MYLIIIISLFIVVGLTILFYVNNVKNIHSVTLKVIPPQTIDGKNYKRVPFKGSPYNKLILKKEAELRKLAYKDTIIKVSPDFYTDQDLTDPYYLILVYHRKTLTPLLSARYFYDKNKIQYYLEGDKNNEQNLNRTSKINLEKLNSILFIDRMSGNHKNDYYKKYWKIIHLLFYSELIKHNKNRHLIGMARIENGEKLLKKYTYLGLKVADEVIHNGVSHNIFIEKLNTCLKNANFKFKYTLKYIMTFQIKKIK